VCVSHTWVSVDRELDFGEFVEPLKDFMQREFVYPCSSSSDTTPFTIKHAYAYIATGARPLRCLDLSLR
jgi:hypothetical protein